ncbi:hypothetical protein EVAR_41767_1 [Eumeta japonica]|uniref:Uncharacterized protein n=1 Tax=Eumeta variegata TaxID=151549 RepID=A0A4C1VYL8_EUMVA|nr:hypothetical protein EVAR_41767_1 [Eumeta japonica]
MNSEETETSEDLRMQGQGCELSASECVEAARGHRPRAARVGCNCAVSSPASKPTTVFESIHPEWTKG